MPAQTRPSLETLAHRERARRTAIKKGLQTHGDLQIQAKPNHQAKALPYSGPLMNANCNRSHKLPFEKTVQGGNAVIESGKEDIKKDGFWNKTWGGTQVGAGYVTKSVGVAGGIIPSLLKAGGNWLSK